MRLPNQDRKNIHSSPCWIPDLVGICHDNVNEFARLGVFQPLLATWQEMLAKSIIFVGNLSHASAYLKVAELEKTS